MAEQNSSYNADWLEAIVRFAETSCRQNKLWGDFLSNGYDFRNELSWKRLPGIDGAEYQPVWGAIGNSAKKFIAAASDKQEAAGALFWRLLKSPYPGQERDAVQHFRKERRYQRNMLSLINMMDLPLSARDKINALTYLNYKYTTEEYLNLYKMLGDFDIGKNPDTQAYEQEQTVRLFFDLFESSKKSTWGNKVSSAAVLLETIARNAPRLKRVVYNGQMINAEARAKMRKIMEKGHQMLSLQCLSYLSSADEPEDTKIDDCWERKGAEIYIGVVLNKFGALRGSNQQKLLLDDAFPKIHSLIEKSVMVSDKLIDNYSAYLSLYAAEFRDREVSVDVLEQLLLRNAKQKNEFRIQESLFPELLCDEELPQYDKNNVRKVVENYSESLERGHLFNQSFNDDMVSLLQRIVSSNPYQKEEVQAICGVLRGTDMEETCGVQAARALMSHYTSFRFVDDWRVSGGC